MRFWGKPPFALSPKEITSSLTHQRAFFVRGFSKRKNKYLNQFETHCETEITLFW